MPSDTGPKPAVPVGKIRPSNCISIGELKQILVPAVLSDLEEYVNEGTGLKLYEPYVIVTDVAIYCFLINLL
jgi:hypothetical protein